MTAAFLQSELLSLISDSKRKQSDVRTAAEKSLAELKSISITSETQLAEDLLRKHQFIDPFVLACSSKYTKLAVTGTTCLQRLVASRALPKARLTDVLDAFQEAAHQGLDVQLKILQALPSLLQLYATELHGEPLAKILSLCAGLAGSKTGMVSSTATATFQQLITSVFERKQDELSPAETSREDGESLKSDASNIFADMCMITKGQAPEFLRSQGVSQHLALEVIENCLMSEDLVILERKECMSACQAYLVPGIIELLEKSSNIAVFGQCLRIVHILVANYLVNLLGEISKAINIILDWLDRGPTVGWKRLFCLELIRDICSDFQLLRTVYNVFDNAENRRHLIQDLAAILVRIASEDPSLIGLGRQSTMPTNSANDGATNGSSSVDVNALDAVGSVMQASSNATGISSQWSLTKISLLEQTERSSPPDIPETYVYTLVLACVAAISDGLSKFIMPLSVPPRLNQKVADTEEDDEDTGTPRRKNSMRSQKYHRLLNPLKRDDIADTNGIKVCAKLIESCWPAILAICSTFLNSALDSHFYHILVRTIQKLAQVSGVLELNTPRDALLTTLAKVSVPLNVQALISLLYGNKLAKKFDFDARLEDDTGSSKSPATPTARPSIDFTRQTLNVRNLLCLRALLNLGIALGPTLGDASWFIVIQALQQVDALMSVSPTARSATSTPNLAITDGEGQTSLGNEIAAVGTASKRMIESTRNYSDSTLAILLRSVFQMIDDLTPFDDEHAQENGKHVQKALPSRIGRMHKTSRSISGAVASAKVLKIEAEFVLKTVSDIARVNLHRFTSLSSTSCSWDLFPARLLDIVAGKDIDADLRLQAASIIDVISMETAKLLEKQNLSSEALDTLQQTCLSSLLKQIGLLNRPGAGNSDTTTADVEIHRRLLEALENIVSHSGDSLTGGWQVVFEILQLTVQPAIQQENGHRSTASHEINDTKFRTILPAFRTIQMIVSDFLDSIDAESLWVLVQLLPLFGMQENDVNISLTTASLFWSVNGLILHRTTLINVSDSLSANLSPVDNPDSVIASEASTLWFATMMHLARLCGDHRTDVRNGALRVMLRIFDASSEQLTPDMWNMSLCKVLLPLLLQYSTTIDSVTDWHASYAHLLAGTITLINNNLQAIVDSDNVEETWKELAGVFQSMLEQNTSAGHSSVFSGMTDLLRALALITPCPKEVVLHLLQLWFDFHPANIKQDDGSSPQAFVDHAKVLVEVDKCAHEALLDPEPIGQRPYRFVMQSTKRTILSAKQSRYADDIKKLTPEQEAVVINLQVLRSIMSDHKNEYTIYLLDLIESVLARHIPLGDAKQTIETSSSSWKPKLIAFMSQCINILRSEIPNAVGDVTCITDLAVPESLQTFEKVILSKYSSIPTNDTAPAWKTATTTCVEMIEALQRHNQQLEIEQIRSIADTLPAIAKAILNAPYLERKLPQPLHDRVMLDESFDVDQFERLHKALITMMYREDFPDSARKQYMLILFNASLIAKPWFGDFSSDLLTQPLTKFTSIRAGSIRKPDFYMRKSISCKALEALLGLVSNNPPIGQDIPSTRNPIATAKAAAPYFLLRFAHTIKTFLADQHLRQLNAPPEPIQKELNIILSKFLDLRCQDRAFTEVPGLNVSSALAKDGKSHLRILYPLVTKLKDLWVKLPRLEVCAWQDDEDGLAVQKALRRWSKTISENWLIE